MSKARLYQLSKSATQSGIAKTHNWVLEILDPLSFYKDTPIGWCGSSNTTKQMQLSFKNINQALRYAQAHGLEVSVEKPLVKITKPKSYADNFKAYRAT